MPTGARRPRGCDCSSGALSVPARRTRALLGPLLLALGGILIAVGGMELVLRAADFRYQAIREVQFGWPEPQVIANEFATDPDLLG